ncbi:MAG: hypothetical protein Q7K43_00735, partial [Candidatus Woesearchaeota archaeon]|nr:hypothetical protein [Candidatus Woesearchaeota archaeon]
MVEIDISAVLKESIWPEVGLPIIITETDFAYPVKDDVWLNWFPFAYIAFRRLVQKRIESFATIGAGSGADAIGAGFIFKNLKTIVLSDIDQRVIPVAVSNVKKYAPTVTVVGLAGHLCEPLRKNKMQIDVMYENLPNISDAGNIAGRYR